MTKSTRRSPDSDSDGWILGLLIIAAMLIGLIDCSGCEGLVHAQEAPLPAVGGTCASDTPEPRRARLTYGEAPGWWFHRDLAVCMIDRLEALPLYAERVRLLEQRLVLSDERAALQARQVALAEEGEQTAVDALEAAVRARRQAEEDRDAWFRHPAFWAVLGAVIVVVLEAVAVWAFGELKP